MPVLVEHLGRHRRIYEIADDIVLLGRLEGAVLHDVFAGHKGVSRRHAQIGWGAGQWMIEDLGSRNGTLLNGQLISQPTPLQEGDKLTIGELELVFYSRLPPATLFPHPPEEQEAAKVVLDEEDAQVVSSVPMPDRTTAFGLIGTNPERKLRALIGTLNELGKSLEIDRMLDELLGGLLNIFPAADRGFAGLKADNDNQVRIRAVRTRRRTDSSEAHVSRTVLNHVVATKQAILSANVGSDERFDSSRSIAVANLRSLMCAPLLDQSGDVLGVVQIDTVTDQEPFSPDDLEVFAGVALQAALVLQYARMHEAALHREAFECDLRLARRVQLDLLPTEQPALAGYSFFAFYEAAYEVGGDYYDYVELGGGRLAVVLADASGKGVSAALLMAKVAGEMRYLLSSKPTIAAAVASINDSLCSQAVMGRFVTLVVAAIDPAANEACIVNAGHLPPLLRRADGSIQELGADARGPAAGIMPGRVYKEVRLPLAPGDSLTLFTDGFSEAANGQDELYGLERLKQIAGLGMTNPDDLGQRIMEDVRRFVGPQPQSDDRCLVCFGRLGA